MPRSSVLAAVVAERKPSLRSENRDGKTNPGAPFPEITPAIRLALSGNVMVEECAQDARAAQNALAAAWWQDVDKSGDRGRQNRAK